MEEGKDLSGDMWKKRGNICGYVDEGFAIDWFMVDIESWSKVDINSLCMYSFLVWCKFVVLQ